MLARLQGAEAPLEEEGAVQDRPHPIADEPPLSAVEVTRIAQPTREHLSRLVRRGAKPLQEIDSRRAHPTGAGSSDQEGTLDRREIYHFHQVDRAGRTKA